MEHASGVGVSTALGVIGVVSAFGLFYLGERVFHIDRAHIQTLMYLKLSVAGHLTIFLTRTRGPFWSIRPARILWVAVLGTQILATVIAVYGVFMTPLGWGWAGFVWAYALAWFLLNDRVKLLAYRIFDPTKQPLLATEQLDLTPQIAARAYDLYEHRGPRRWPGKSRLAGGGARDSKRGCRTQLSATEGAEMKIHSEKISVCALSRDGKASRWPSVETISVP